MATRHPLSSPVGPPLKRVEMAKGIWLYHCENGSFAWLEPSQFTLFTRRFPRFTTEYPCWFDDVDELTAVVLAFWRQFHARTVYIAYYHCAAMAEHEARFHTVIEELDDDAIAVALTYEIERGDKWLSGGLLIEPEPDQPWIVEYVRVRDAASVYIRADEDWVRDHAVATEVEVVTRLAGKVD